LPRAAQMDNFDGRSSPPPGDVLAVLSESLGRVTPQQRVAAQYILDHPYEVGVSSLRRLADAAGVTPNTLVRLAQSLGFDGFESLREPFRESARSGPTSPLERGEWLQAVAGEGSAGQLFGAVAGAALDNLEKLLREIKPEQVRDAARTLLKARHIYVLGVSTLVATARYFVANARMAMSNVYAVPTDGSLPSDDLARMGAKDVLLVMTFEPYRREVVEAAIQANRQGAAVMALTDSWKSPVIASARQSFIIPAAAPHLFTSIIALSAVLELLIAFIIKEGKKGLRDNIREFHRRRFDLGMYWTS
jgi:DNA-binding MurR/RpiR family transcriptional regulator